MIFQYTLDLLLSGRKTQTRRVAKAGETAIQADGQIIAVQTHGRDKYRVGKTYAVQPSRNAASVARIRLVGIRQQRAGDISLEDAQAEGYASREEFFAQWQAIHGADKLNLTVWVLTFELAEIES